MPQSGISMNAKNSTASFIEDNIPFISNFKDANATLTQLQVIKINAINKVTLNFFTASLRRVHIQTVPKAKKYILARSWNWILLRKTLGKAQKGISKNGTT